MNSMVKLQGIEWSVRQIKENLREGHAVHAERQSGKTTALLEYICDNMILLACNVAFVSANMDMSMRAKNLFESTMEPLEKGRMVPLVRFISSNNLEKLRGRAMSLVVDDWWLVSEAARRDMVDNFKILAAAGTIPLYSSIPLI